MVCPVVHQGLSWILPGVLSSSRMARNELTGGDMRISSELVLILHDGLNPFALAKPAKRPPWRSIWTPGPIAQKSFECDGGRGRLRCPRLGNYAGKPPKSLCRNSPLFCF
jgi:hypothetical protein